MRRLILALALLGTLAVTASAGPIGVPIQWTVASGGNGHWYQAVVQTASYTDAVAGATALGGYLVTLTSATENRFVFDLATAVSGLWWTDSVNHTHGPRIGAVDAAGNGTWSWVSAEAWSYTNWSPGEPNLIGTETSVELYNAATGHGSGLWNNTAKSLTGTQYSNSLGYLVEFDVLVPEPSTLLLLGPAIGLLAWRRRRHA
jgi:hypothetical protein